MNNNNDINDLKKMIKIKKLLINLENNLNKSPKWDNHYQIKNIIKNNYNKNNNFLQIIENNEILKKYIMELEFQKKLENNTLKNNLINIINNQNILYENKIKELEESKNKELQESKNKEIEQNNKKNINDEYCLLLEKEFYDSINFNKKINNQLDEIIKT